MTVKHDRIVCGDCITELERLDADCVDLAFADPPFNIGYDYDVYNDRRAADDYLDWSRKWIEGVVRVLRPDGAFWLAIGDDYAAELKVLCTRELGLHLRSWVVWFYTFGVHCKNKFTRSHAHLFHFVKDPKRFTFNTLAIRVPSARELVYGDKRADPDGRVPDDTWMMAPVLPPEVLTRDGFILRPQDIPERFPVDSDTWFFSRVAGTFNERRGWHGCQMPEQLLARIIKACSKDKADSNEGDLILDPFTGSGTTLAVAKKLGRRYIGFELSKKYARQAEQRLAGINPGDAVDGPEHAARSAPPTSAGRILDRSGGGRKSRAVISPIVTRANASLRQIAVANGEFSTAIAEAFMASHEGYSADRVLADPSLNDRFLENCRLLGLPGEAASWNHLLLNIRKRGALAAVDTSRRTLIRRDAMEPFMSACEIAWRKVSDEVHCSLDDILCDPLLAGRFDKLAARIAPGFSPFQYRWAALSVRKDASLGNGLLDRIRAVLAPGAVKISEVSALPARPGHYLITATGTPFFVGFATSLRASPLLEVDRLGAALQIMGHGVRNNRDIEIRTRLFDSSAVKVTGAGSVWKAAHRAKLVNRYHPIANVPPSRTAA